MNLRSCIYVAGHRGLVGSAIARALEEARFSNIIVQTRDELDLSDTEKVQRFFEEEKPEYVFLSAAKVGGILANNIYPADFIRTNLEIQNNVIQSCYATKVKRLLFLGSSCIYPREAPQPICEDSLMTGPLEPTNRSYAMAKIAGIEMCWAYNRQYGTRYLAAMPSNLYGPGDNYDLKNSHVLPALINKADAAKKQGSATMEVWGTGTPRRELLYSDDLAAACVFLMQLPEDKFDTLLREDVPPLINIGSGEDISIRDLAELVCGIVGFQGKLTFDTSKPDGTMRKLLNISKIRRLGWSPKMPLRDGIRRVYEMVKDKL